MYKKKKAMTLMEVVIYLGLLSIIVTLFPLSTMYLKKQEKKVKIKDELLEIEQFILESKLICKDFNVMGEIFYIAEYDKLKLSNPYEKKELNLKNLKARQSFEIKINQNGFINKNISVTFLDSLEEKHTIKIN
ncbi:hypothetical protein [Clostridium massiliamazoniense]|uniref:hypothetical protein n=1 Tax=Clostridium massiliamazoniense TaxID=1347366 RepID=UPI0006D7BD99|nr:hypothetical protein [Clostridium massiliamazoniense]